MRKAFAETLYALAKEDQRLVFLTGDLGFQVFGDFEREFPRRFINVGVAEAQLISAAAGLAIEGWHPIAYSITSFATGRPYEQIRFCVGYPHLRVMIVGAGRGFTYSTSGVSHHAMDDIGLMSLIPGMTIVIPGDGDEIRQLMPQMIRVQGPTYFTVGRYGEPVFRAEEPAVLGKARLLQWGERVAIFSTGDITNEVTKALDELRQEGIVPMAYQIHTIRPFDTKALDLAANQAHSFVIVDEHLPTASLWGEMTSWKAISNNPVRMIRLGPPDAFAFGNLKRGDFRADLGYDAEKIADTCRQIYKPRE